MKRFSVIVPYLNTPTINETIQSLINQSFPKPRFEILVVGLDNIQKITEQVGFRFIETPKPFSPAESRNLGASLAEGEFLVFIDADCIADDDMLFVLDKVITDNNYTMVGGGVNPSSNNYWTLADNIAMFHPNLHILYAGKRTTYPSLVLCISREIFFEFGGFNEKYPRPAGEDADLTLRIQEKGVSHGFEPEFQVHHVPPRASLISLLKHGFFQGKYSVKIRRPEPTLKEPRLAKRLILLTFSPAIAGFATIRAFKHLSTWRYIHTFPAVFLSKLAWCFGAATKAKWKTK